jgi:xanthine dehydrogenase molybdopterin-binding subunit B
MNNIMTYGEKGMEAIETRVKEVAASNGLDPDHIWTSMLQRTKEESTTPVEKQPAYEP